MKIGNLSFENGIFLAPLAGITDRAFRQICRLHGAELTFSEMISAKGLHYNDKKTAVLADYSEDEAPFFIQIFGSDPEIMAESAHRLAVNDYPYCKNTRLPDGIDINMGCPVPKIAGNGDGSALMKDPELAYKIIEQVVKSVPCPVSVKMRTGWDENSINAAELAVLAEKAGASFVTVHGRTKKQMYRDPVDISTIASVKKSVSIPVIANGGIYTADDAIDMLKKTCCDGVMIARGAMGNPWIFDEIKCRLEGKEFVPPSAAEKMKTAVSQLVLASKYKDEHIACLEARKHFAYYMKNYRGASLIRAKINSAEKISQFIALAEEFEKSVVENL